MKRIIFCFLFFSSTLFAQYSVEDYQLVKTTFARKFDKSIVTPYLTSLNGDSARAALLSLSNSGDTSFVPEIIKLDFAEYGKLIAFSLGKTGPSKLATNYLWSQLSDTLIANNYSKYIVAAIGKTGARKDLEELLNKYSSAPGTPTAIVNFSTRGFRSDSSFNVLLNLLSNPELNSEHQFEALFALYRLGSTTNAKDIIVEILKSSDSIESIPQKLYAMGCLRRINAFPRDEELSKYLLTHDDWKIRTEAARTICYKSLRSFDELKKYLQLLYDLNPNVSRTAAVSVRELKLTAGINSELESKLMNIISSQALTRNALGELFISYCTLYPEDIEDKIEEFEGKIPQKYLNQILISNLDNPQWNFEYLTDQLEDASEKDMMHIIPPTLALQSKLIGDDNYNKLVTSLLRIEMPAPLSILADGLDTITVWKNSEIIQEILIDQTFKLVNNPQYVESLMSFSTLGGKMSPAFQKTLLNVMASSTVSSISNFANTHLGNNDYTTPKSLEYFDDIWENAFKFSKALVATNKGDFTIQFNPQYAPVSVGNFCLLAQRDYFSDIVFHRVVPNFVIQTGDPSGTGWGGPGYEICSEFSPLPYDEGFVGMASTGKDTEGSQWFVMHSSFPHLDGNYSNFGKVTSGMEVVSKIDQGDKIIKVTLKK